ncbi:MAG: N-acetylmuramoyl-L-alanine amidase family protein [Clostridia bacterium]|nr:N-acetylmuramoyl-L-alanine amidase family protein [Clostridia bacterium]
MRSAVVIVVILSMLVMLGVCACPAAAASWLLDADRAGSITGISDGIYELGGQPYVFLRAVAAAFGYETTWSQPGREATLAGRRVSAVFKAGEKRAWVNGDEVALSSAADMSTGRLAVNARDLAAMGLHVQVDDAAHTVRVGAERVSVTAVSWSSALGDRAMVIEADFDFAYKVFTLGIPDRVVVDLYDSELAAAVVPAIEVEDAPARRVRSAMNRPGLVRVVADMVSPTGFQATYEPGSPARLVVRFSSTISGFELDESAGLRKLVVKADGNIRLGQLEDRPDGVQSFDISGAAIGVGAEEFASSDGAVRIRAEQVDGWTVRVSMLLREGLRAFQRADSASGCGVSVGFAYVVSGVRTYHEPGCTVVELATSAPVAFRTFRLKDPERIGIDLPGVWVFPCSTIEVSSPSVARVRMGQFDLATGRSVIDLLGGGAHSVETSADGKTLKVKVAESPVFGRTVMLDPGHGGTDPGTGKDGLMEKDVNLDIALRLRALLKGAGASVVMTRMNDSNVELSERSRLANSVKPDVFLSIHCNSVLNVFPAGTETFYYNNLPYSQELAALVHSALLKEIELIDRKVSRKDYYVIRETQVPSALVEVAFLSNEVENVKLRDPLFREKAATGLYTGISMYLGSEMFARWQAVQAAPALAPVAGQAKEASEQPPAAVVTVPPVPPQSSSYPVVDTEPSAGSVSTAPISGDPTSTP